MLKKKISKKRDFSLEDIPILKVKKTAKLQKHDSDSFFKDLDKVGAALLQSLIENDTEAFIEILDTYLQVNRDQSRSSMKQVLLKTGNPTLRTIAKIVHQSVA